MSFHPGGARVPRGARSALLLLRPLSVTDVERDYDAVMSSAPMLRRWGQTDWPADDFTLADNRVDLERHEREHREGSAFTFTVLDPSAARCLGCVYIAPLAAEEAAALGHPEHAARVAFWVRSSEIAAGLDRHLFDLLHDWLAKEWAFDVVVFKVSSQETRQASLLVDAGLEGTAVTLADGRAGWLFR